MQEFFDPSPDFTFSADWQAPQADLQPQQRQATSEMERFWGIAGNWGEFGLYFGLGLSASLMVRAIPILQPAAVILVPAVGAALTALSFAAPTDRTKYQILLIATTAAIIAGNWDGWIAWLIANAWKIALSLVLIGIGIHFIPSAGGKKNV